MNLVRIALRNLGRTKSRTALSLVSIAVGVMVVILFKGVIDGVWDQLVTGTIRFSSGHVRIVDPEYLLKEQLMSLYYPVDADVANQAASVSGVVAASPRIRFSGLISRENQADGVMVTGFDPRREEPVSQMSRYLTGRYMERGAREAVVGGSLLRKQGLTVGDRFTLVFNTAFGSMRGYTLEIVGRVDSGYAWLDEQLFVDLGLAQAMLEMPGEATEVLVMGSSQRETKALVSALQAGISDRGELSFVPWHSASEMMELMSLAQVIYFVIYLVVLALAAFVVVNTMVMIVAERIREIGMLAALGLSGGQILLLFLYEGTVLGVLGSLVGGLLGGVLLRVLSTTGITMDGMDTIDPQYFITPTIYPVFSWTLLLLMMGAGVVVTMAAVWLPARRAARLEPTQALRGEV